MSVQLHGLAVYYSRGGYAQCCFVLWIDLKLLSEGFVEDGYVPNESSSQRIPAAVFWRIGVIG